ncbi:MAG: hypothetical protein AABW73_04320 [Nanoarchaeota archaeon]
MNKGLTITLGLILVIAPIIVGLYFPSWGRAAIELVKGGIMVGVMLAGLLLLLLGISELKN